MPPARLAVFAEVLDETTQRFARLMETGLDGGGGGVVMDVVRRARRLAWAALRLEVTLYLALARWVTRRPDVPTGTTPIGYSRLVAPMLWLWIFGSATEVVVLDVLLSRWWTPLRIPLLVVGIWGLVWMLGMMSAYRTRPHLLGDDSLQVRDGIHARVDVRLERIASVRSVDHELPGLLKSVHVEGEGDTRDPADRCRQPDQPRAGAHRPDDPRDAARPDDRDPGGPVGRRAARGG